MHTPILRSRRNITTARSSITSPRRRATSRRCHSRRVGALPALSKGYVTFASFNQTDKLTSAVYALWSRLLRALPDSRLVLIADEFGARSARAAFAAEEVSEARLSILGKLPMNRYLDLHNEVDIGLAPFPYSGSTVSRNALLMGVPVVTLAGETAASRATFALLTQMEMHDFAATTDDEYVATALRAARDIERLAEIRRTLRDRVQRAPFSDAAAYTRAVEAGYRRIWREWCGA